LKRLRLSANGLGELTDADATPEPDALGMTLVWFVIWLIFDLVGDKEPLLFAPVNWWAGALLLAIAVDLSRHHAPAPRSR
jgi:hypothetical protein